MSSWPEKYRGRALEFCRIADSFASELAAQTFLSVQVRTVDIRHLAHDEVVGKCLYSKKIFRIVIASVAKQPRVLPTAVMSLINKTNQSLLAECHPPRYAQDLCTRFKNLQFQILQSEAIFSYPSFHS